MLSLDDIARRALEHADDRMPTIDQLLEALVRIPSGSTNLEGNRRCLQVMAGGFAALGFRAALLGAEGGREHLLCRRDGQPGAPTLLLLGHTDTAYHEGHPFTGFWTEGGRARGPGVANMKGGLVVMLTVLDTLAELQLLDAFHIRALLTTDQQDGSTTSVAMVRSLAAQAQLALVFEAARPDGSLVTSRRASGRFTLDVLGRAADAGSAHAEGRSAILELAYKIPKVDGLTNPKRGITVNCGVVEGGSRPNVVAERARLLIDARCEGPMDARFIETRLQEIADDVMLRGCETTVSGGFDRPVWPRSAATAELLSTWARSARALRQPPLEGVHVGDGSDANHSHAAGAPTLDGLGPVGGGYHTDQEWADLRSFAERAALSATALALWRAKLAKTHGAQHFAAPDDRAISDIARVEPLVGPAAPAEPEAVDDELSRIDHDPEALLMYDIDFTAPMEDDL